MIKIFHNGKITLYQGDCLAVLDTLEENSVDSVIADSPYHLASIVKRFGKGGKPLNGTGSYQRLSKGFMGKTWDGGQIAHEPETWAKVLRVLKPGGHLVAFHAPKNWHRLVCAIEDAGFEIRDNILDVFSASELAQSFVQSLDIDQINILGRLIESNDPLGDIFWMFGSGFPKSHNLKGDYEGFGTALKPAYEPIVLARKSVIGTIADCVEAFGTGVVNIAATKIGKEDNKRWPANVVHDGSDQVILAFPDVPGQQRAVLPGQAKGTNGIYSDLGTDKGSLPRNDAGSAARFFYNAKADASDRVGSKHPTVKPISLMRWLVRLITPPGGIVLDPFAGTGTTAEAAFLEGFSSILIEREAEYCDDICRRMELMLSGSFERVGKLVEQSDDLGPLFGGAHHE